MEYLEKLKTFYEKYSLFLSLAVFILASSLLAYFLLKDSKGEVNTNNSIGNIVENQLDENIDNVRWYVDIQGQVLKPGVYEIAEGEILYNLIQKAGGFTEAADLHFVQQCMNQSIKLKDQQKIYLPAKSEKKLCQNNTIQESTQTAKININTASVSELENLKGVGPSTANLIIENRPYTNIKDLLDVAGIGDKTFEGIKDDIII